MSCLFPNRVIRCKRGVEPENGEGLDRYGKPRKLDSLSLSLAPSRPVYPLYRSQTTMARGKYAAWMDALFVFADCRPTAQLDVTRIFRIIRKRILLKIRFKNITFVIKQGIYCSCVENRQRLSPLKSLHV